MKQIISVRWKPILLTFLVVAGIILPSVSNVLLNTKQAAAYTYTNNLVTDSDGCLAEGGTWKTDTAPIVSYCQMTSRPDENAKVIANGSWLGDCLYLANMAGVNCESFG